MKGQIGGGLLSLRGTVGEAAVRSAEEGLREENRMTHRPADCRRSSYMQARCPSHRSWQLWCLLNSTTTSLSSAPSTYVPSFVAPNTLLEVSSLDIFQRRV
ncbi:hypothetical protein K443DRAFT_686312, partial [Laccaria amethystina LaAM-08-1]